MIRKLAASADIFVERFTFDGQAVDATCLQGATVPPNVQIVGSWQAGSTILRVASMLEGVTQVRGLHPS